MIITIITCVVWFNAAEAHKNGCWYNTGAHGRLLTYPSVASCEQLRAIYFQDRKSERGEVRNRCMKQDLPKWEPVQ